MLETFNSADKTLVLRSNHVSKEFFVKMTKCRENGHFIDINLICGESDEEGEENIQHSSEIRGLRSTKCSSKTLPNLLYFMYKKTHVVFFVFHIVQLYIFTL